jgi:hypothetical protein
MRLLKWKALKTMIEQVERLGDEQIETMFRCFS